MLLEEFDSPRPAAAVATADSPGRIHSRTCPCPQSPCLRATAVRIHERRLSRGRAVGPGRFSGRSALVYRTMKISVPPDIERALTARAHALGTTPEILAVDSLREHLSSESDLDEKPAELSEAKTLADLLDGYVGVLHSSEHVSGGAQLSEHTGKKFADGLARKRAAGRL